MADISKGVHIVIVNKIFLNIEASNIVRYIIN